MKKKLKFEWLIPLVVSATLMGLSLLPFYKILVHKIDDLVLQLKPAVPENERLLFLDIDDGTLEKVGVWPVSRHIMAEGLILLKEFGADYTLFDIEYVDARPYQLSEDDLYKGIEAVVARTRQKKSGSLAESTRTIFRNNDLYLGQAAHLFGKAFFTVRAFNEIDESRQMDEKYLAYALDKIALKNVETQTNKIPVALEIQPPILPVLQGAKGAGFVNSEIDIDGVLRRVNLLIRYQDAYLPQLAFAPLLDLLGQPRVIAGDKKIILQGARLPHSSGPAGEDVTEEQEPQDLVIPLDENNKFLINWSREKFLPSFRHLSFWQLVLHKELEKRLLANLSIMQAKGYLHAYQGGVDLVENYHTIEDILADILSSGPLPSSIQLPAGSGTGDEEVDESQLEIYREARTVFFEDVKEFLFGATEAGLLEDIDSYLTSGKLSEQEKRLYSEVKAGLPEEFARTREVYRELETARSILQKEIPGSFCLIGHTSASTEDIGITPFQKEYVNVGLHINILNTILNKRFLETVPFLYVWLGAILLALTLVFILRPLPPLPTVLAGLIFLTVLLAGCLLLLMNTGFVFDLLTPFLTIFLTFFLLSLAKFLLLEKEKSFLRNAFSYYLSAEVINELIIDPSKLQLGGDKGYLTTIFTDIKGFSAISEQLDPTDLVKLLNTYLTEMSNIILDLKGTIDKYEGDAIIAFFGAPVPFEDHARRACLAAVRMKKIEAYLNSHLLEQKFTPTPLLTRIGINTGEMVVGNMGTQKKMNYTVMGHAVNLAARLEGVNKQYGTWILMSESTYLESGYDFFVRMLDKVRVFGIQHPVRLYELLDEKSQVSPVVKEGVEIFHAGLQEFEKRNWDKAEELFNNTLKLLPEDGPASILCKRCQKYKLEAPPANWDNVYNLGVK